MTPLARPFVLAATLAALALPAAAGAHDLLTVWRAAAAHDRGFAVARAEHDASQALRAQAGALWRPQVTMNLEGGLGTQETAMRGARFSAPGLGQVDDARFATSVAPGLATRVAIVGQQPLVNAARRARQAQLNLGADMGDTAWHNEHSALMLATAERYFALALAEKRVRVTARQAAALARMRAEAHERYRIGSSPITDTHEADAALAGIRAQQQAAALAASVQREVLAGSTGLVEPSARLPASPPGPVAGLPAWLEAADAGNPRLRLLAQAVEAAGQKLHEQRVAGRPTLDVAAQARHERIGGHGDFGSARTRSVDGMVGVQLSIPLWTGGMLAAKEREAAGQLARAQAELELARETVRQQVYAAWLGLQAGAARVTALDDALAASAARLDATRLGREVGDRTTLDVLGAENAHAEAELALAQARSEQALDRLRLAALADQLDEALLAHIDATLAPAAPEARP